MDNIAREYHAERVRQLVNKCLQDSQESFELFEEVLQIERFGESATITLCLAKSGGLEVGKINLFPANNVCCIPEAI